VPFELDGMGANTLGVYVCQWGFIAVVWNGPFFDSLAHLSGEKHLGENLLSGTLQVKDKQLAPCVSHRVARTPVSVCGRRKKELLTATSAMRTIHFLSES
jgi:hypothetical protein